MPNISPDVVDIENLIDLINLRGQNDSSLNISNLNSFIDELNAYSYKSSLAVSNERLDKLLRNICLSVPPENSLTVAKYCQLVVNLNSRKRLELSDATLAAYSERLALVLETRADLSYLDILQLIRILTTSHVDYFSKNYSRLLNVLLKEIELDATLADAQAIKLYRLHCLLDITPYISPEDSRVLIDKLLGTIYSQDSSNPILLSKVWCSCLEGIGRVLPKAKEVEDLPRLIGAIVAALKLGLGAARPGGGSQKTAGPQRPDLPPSVSPVYPTPLPPVTNENITNRGNESNKLYGSGGGGLKKWKGKTKEVEWCGEESLACWPSERHNSASDSDISDSESGKRAREFSKTRYTAAYTIVHIVKVLDRKVVSGYYSLLLGPGCLQASLISDSMLKPKLAAVIATRTILIQAKPYLALAQHSESKSFTAYCEGLSELLVSLHSSISLSLSCGGGYHAVTALLHSLATLATVCPYHRLKSGLITRSLTTLLPHLHSSNSKEMVSAVLCLGTYLSLDNQPEELKNVIVTGPPGSALSFSKSRSAPWITALCLIYLQKTDVENEYLRLAQWQLLGSLAAHHFDSCVYSELASFEDLIIAELSSTNQTTAVHIHALQTLAIILEQLSSNAEYTDECMALWNRLLGGPLVPFLQDSTSTAASACDCISHINQQCFYLLSEKRQIGLMTLIYGCCYHEEKSVRASAIKVLGVLLNFPNMANETYLYDIIDILIRSASDTSDFCRMRASWAFGNLADLLRTKEQDFVEEVSLIKLIEACLILSKDSGSAKVNVVRALGALLSLVRERDIKDPVFREALDKSTTVLVKSTNSGIFMKVRWNACHAISHILANEALYLHTSNWFERLVRSLCSLLIKCNHFKVRSNACTALRSIKKRSHFGQLYEFVWESLLDGLDNSANMPDFKEYKQQNDLLNQLCMAVCHILSLLEEKDIATVQSLLEYREDCLSRFLNEFVSRAPPEVASSALLAHSNITRLNVFSSLSAALAPAI